MATTIPSSEIADCKLFVSTGEKLYLSDDLADIHFVFETDGIVLEKVPAHKLLLSCSDVFRAMFTGMWKEKDEVTITDTNPAAFKEFLQFFYRNKVQLTAEHVNEVMNLANMYNVPEGLSICANFIKKRVNPENVCRAYPSAILFDHERLIRYCDYIVRLNTSEVLSSPSFMECDREVLKHILNLSVFSCKEDHVFEQCMNWVKAKAKVDNLTRNHIQQHLGDFFYEFRFKSMLLNELVDLFHKYGHLFSPEECKDLLTLASSHAPSKFTEKYRLLKGSRADVIVCNVYRNVNNMNSCKPYYLKDIETTTFSVNKPILLTGIVFVRVFSYTGPEDITSAEEYCRFIGATDDVLTEISIFEGDGAKIHYEVACLKERSHTVSFDKEILIKPDIKYKIQMKQELNGRKVCIHGYVKEKVKLDQDIIVMMHGYQTIDGDQHPRSMIGVLAFQNLTN